MEWDQEKEKNHYFVGIGERGIGILSRLINTLDKQSSRKASYSRFFLVALSSKHRDTIEYEIPQILHPSQITHTNFDGTEVWSNYPDNEELIKEKIAKPFFKWLNAETGDRYEKPIYVFFIASLYSGTSQGIIQYLFDEVKSTYKDVKFFGIFVLPTSIETTGPVEIYNSILALENTLNFTSTFFVDYLELGKKFNSDQYPGGDFGDLDGKVSSILLMMFVAIIPMSSLFITMQVYERLNMFYPSIAQPSYDFLPERGKNFNNWTQGIQSLFFTEKDDVDFPIARYCILVGEGHDLQYVDEAIKQLSSELEERSYFTLPPLRFSISPMEGYDHTGVLILENSTSILTCKFRQLYLRFAKMYERKVFFHVFTQHFEDAEKKLATAASRLKLILDAYRELFI